MKTQTFIVMLRITMSLCLFFISFVYGYSQGCHGGGGGSSSGHNHKNNSNDATDATQNYKVTYTCSMHPEIVTGLPGKCPKCGMDLDKKVSKNVDNTKSTKKKYYACKVHSEIKSGSKGNCSICGKKLKKKVDYIY